MFPGYSIAISDLVVDTGTGEHSLCILVVASVEALDIRRAFFVADALKRS